MLAEIIGSALAREQSQIALQAAKNAAETANRAKTEFLANMSHELRTPLNGILGYAQLLKRSDDLSPNSLLSVEAIEHCGDHLLMLISEILDLAKIEAGRLELENSTFELHEFLSSVADIARLGATQAGLTFSHETRSAIPHVITADRNKLRQILLNLLGNAVKFTESGTVSFRVSGKPSGDRAHRLRFEIEDTGLGIPADELEHIFRPFHQIKRIDRQVEGTGLGLAICPQTHRLDGGNSGSPQYTRSGQSILRGARRSHFRRSSSRRPPDRVASQRLSGQPPARPHRRRQCGQPASAQPILEVLGF